MDGMGHGTQSAQPMRERVYIVSKKGYIGIMYI